MFLHFLKFISCPLSYWVLILLILSSSVLEAFPVFQSSSTIGSWRLGLENGLFLSLIFKSFIFFLVKRNSINFFLDAVHSQCGLSSPLVIRFFYRPSVGDLTTVVSPIDKLSYFPVPSIQWQMKTDSSSPIQGICIKRQTCRGNQQYIKVVDMEEIKIALAISETLEISQNHCQNSSPVQNAIHPFFKPSLTHSLLSLPPLPAVDIILPKLVPSYAFVSTQPYPSRVNPQVSWFGPNNHNVFLISLAIYHYSIEPITVWRRMWLVQ